MAGCTPRSEALPCRHLAWALSLRTGDIGLCRRHQAEAAAGADGSVLLLGVWWGSGYVCPAFHRCSNVQSLSLRLPVFVFDSTTSGLPLRLCPLYSLPIGLDSNVRHLIVQKFFSDLLGHLKLSSYFLVPREHFN